MTTITAAERKRLRALATGFYDGKDTTYSIYLAATAPAELLRLLDALDALEAPAPPAEPPGPLEARVLAFLARRDAYDNSIGDELVRDLLAALKVERSEHNAAHGHSEALSEELHRITLAYDAATTRAEAAEAALHQAGAQGGAAAVGAGGHPERGYHGGPPGPERRTDAGNGAST